MRVLSFKKKKNTGSWAEPTYLKLHITLWYFSTLRVYHYVWRICPLYEIYPNSYHCFTLEQKVKKWKRKLSSFNNYFLQNQATVSHPESKHNNLSLPLCKILQDACVHVHLEEISFGGFLCVLKMIENRDSWALRERNCFRNLGVLNWNFNKIY